MLGATLCAGLSLRWLRDVLGRQDEEGAYGKLSALASQAPAGSAGLFFLPYLAGERSPLMDPLARGCYIGLDLKHESRHMARAVMEGVSFALRQVVETIDDLGVHSGRLLASGNGLADPFWRQITADILKRPLLAADEREQTGFGAALLGGIGAGIFSGYEELRQLLKRVDPVSDRQTILPRGPLTETYDRSYQEFLRLYPRLQSVFRGLAAFPGQT
jgi:xylulokinase